MNWRKLPPAIKLSTAATLVALAGAGLYSYTQKTNFLVADAYASAAATSATPAIQPAASEPVRNPAGLPNFAEIAASQGQAVVNISVAGTIKTMISGFKGMPKPDPDDPFADFFRRFQPQIPRGGVPTRGRAPASSSARTGWC
jgi:serine protease Do